MTVVRRNSEAARRTAINRAEPLAGFSPASGPHTSERPASSGRCPMLDGRVAVVTGASRGVGEALARGLARVGATVALLARTKAATDRVAEHIRRDGGQALPVRCDVGNREEVFDAFREVKRELGPASTLVNNAAIDLPTPSASVDANTLGEILSVNVAGALWCCQAVFSQVRETRGSIVNLSSIAAQVGLAGIAPYAASKAALEQLTRTLATEWAPSGVRVNAIAPGFLSHAMAGNEEAYSDEDLRGLTAAIPLGRLGEPSDLVGPVVFLASEASAFITGTILSVDGGYGAGRTGRLGTTEGDESRP